MKRLLSLLRPALPALALLYLQPSAALHAQERPAPEKAGETEAAAKAPAPYIRFKEDRNTARLELAVRSFKNKAGKQVDLVSAVHIADRSYYQELNKRLAEYDTVLYELVGDPEALQPPAAEAGGAEEAAPESAKDENESAADGEAGEEPELQFRVLKLLYDALGNFLKLSFQLNEMDYTSPKFIHADMTAEEFTRAQRERGESMLSLMLRSMEMQLKGRFNEERKQLESFNLGTLLYILTSPRGAEEFKILLARMLVTSESMTAKAEAESGSVILAARNDVALKKLAEVLRKPDAPRKTAIFYGAAHMQDMERKLTENMGFQPAGEYWIPAWTVEKRAEGK